MSCAMSYDDLHKPVDGPDVVLMTHEQHSLLWDAIDKLPTRLKEVIHLIHIEGHSKAEAARRMDVSRQAVGQYHKQAIKKLKEILAESDD